MHGIKHHNVLHINIHNNIDIFPISYLHCVLYNSFTVVPFHLRQGTMYAIGNELYPFIYKHDDNSCNLHKGTQANPIVLQVK